jgi:hypothetical protein
MSGWRYHVRSAAGGVALQIGWPVIAALFVIILLAGVFAIEEHYGQQERDWQQIADDLDE